MKKIPATVVTGFLGAGKTTLIRHVLETDGQRKIALIVNEFGELGFDGELLASCGIEGCDEEGIIELANGCICCTVAEEFTPAMEAILNRNPLPDHIVIETSGLALPQPLVRAFNWPSIRTRVSVDGVVAVVDGPAVSDGLFAHDLDAIQRQRVADENLDHESPLSELFEDQLACADMIILNKCDALSETSLPELHKQLRVSSRSGVSIVATSQGMVDPAVVLGIDAAAETDLESRREIHHFHEDEDDKVAHGHEEFETFVLNLPEVVGSRQLTECIRLVSKSNGILRLKGFAAVQNKPFRLVVQAVGPRVESFYDRPFQSGESRRTQLIVIAQAEIDRHSVCAAFEELCA